MSDRRLIVLKFGGSVLEDRDSLPRVVHEIYRFRREGYGVVAVVSAFNGETDRALQETRESSDGVRASYAATRERHVAALLAVAADEAGVPACVLTAEALQLTATGDALDSSPRSVDTAPLRQALDDDLVAVVPGFTAVDEVGRTVLLGRGGSDLTAIFLAATLEADRCRLVKDVDGLYTGDPAAPGPEPSRFERVSWTEAATLGGDVLQPRAVQHAEQSGVHFEIGTFGTTEPTTVGDTKAVYALPRNEDAPLRVALLGCGTVGGGVLAGLHARPDLFDVRVVAVKNLTRARGLPTASAWKWTGDALLAVRKDVDIVVETIGGTSTACGAVVAALARGIDTVTANKTLIAEHGRALAETALKSGARLLTSAAVGGSVPLLERLTGLDHVTRIRGILNGTTNFVLERLREGDDLVEAEAEARRRGLAEASAWRDLAGLDAADKLVLVANTLTGRWLDPGTIERETLEDALKRHGNAGTRERPLRQVARLDLGPGPLRGRVLYEQLEEGDRLRDVRDAGNAAVIERSPGETIFIHGTGAGRTPTAQSVLGDLLELARNRRGRARTVMAS